MSIREANRAKKWLFCLKCGRKIYTDRCHRVCPKCQQKNEKEGRIRFLSVGLQRSSPFESWIEGDLLSSELARL